MCDTEVIGPSRSSHARGICARRLRVGGSAQRQRACSRAAAAFAPSIERWRVAAASSLPRSDAMRSAAASTCVVWSWSTGGRHGHHNKSSGGRKARLGFGLLELLSLCREELHLRVRLQ